MKFKIFAALLAAVFMIVSFISCGNSETEDTNLYSYTITVSLSNKGNLSDTAAAEIEKQLEKSNAKLENLTPTLARQAFDKVVTALDASMNSTGNNWGNTYFKITVTLNNVTSGKCEASKDIVVGTSVN